jgi:hypothetical protein
MPLETMEFGVRTGILGSLTPYADNQKASRAECLIATQQSMAATLMMTAACSNCGYVSLTGAPPAIIIACMACLAATINANAAAANAERICQEYFQQMN